MKRISNWSDWLRSAHSDHHAIARGMAWISLFVLLASLVRAAREVAIAYRYGANAEVDAYLFLFALVNWPVGLWFSVLTVVLVPLAARIRREASAELPEFRSELLGLALIVSLVLASVEWFGLPLLLKSSWTGLEPSTVRIALNIAPVLALLAPLGILIGLFSAWMLAARWHINTFLESVPALVVLVALLALPGDDVTPLVWGTLVGFLFHLTSVVIPFARNGEIKSPRFSHHSPHWSAFFQGFGIMLVGQLLMSFIGIIDQFFAAHLGTGAVATIGYANRILGLLLGLGAIAVSRASLPIFSQRDAKEQSIDHTYGVAILWSGLLFVLGMVVLIIGWWLALPAVELFFQRGAFTANDSLAVSEAFRVGLLQLPFYFGGLVLVSFLASQRRYKLIAISAGVNFFVKIGANFILVPFMGISGIIMATSVMYIGSFFLLYRFAKLSLR